MSLLIFTGCRSDDPDKRPPATPDLSGPRQDEIAARRRAIDARTDLSESQKQQLRVAAEHMNPSGK
jgi:hypothetical protein